MGKRIDQFWDDLRTQLTDIDARLHELKGKIDSKAHNAEQDVRNHLDKLEKRIAQDQTKIRNAQTEIRNWVEAHEVETKNKIYAWEDRADRADRYLAAAKVVAAGALNEAERASLEAWLARCDAELAAVSSSIR